MQEIKIEIFTDVVCPWCLIGQIRLDQVLARHFGDFQIRIEHRPVILMPDIPETGIKIADVLRSRGLDPATVQSRPEQEAKGVALELDLNLQQWFYPTKRAHTLIRLARQKGTEHEIAVAIARAYFCEARNIADPHELAALAGRYGFSHAEALSVLLSETELELTAAECVTSQKRGVRGVPHYIFNGTQSSSGHHSEHGFIAAIDRSLDPVPAGFKR
jgi:predicted DsbA family dithiol-disulfide isomerase